MPARFVTVGTAGPEQLAGDNPARRVLAVFNNDTVNYVFIDQGRTNLTTEGYPVGPRSQVVLLVRDGDEPQTEWWAQATGGSVNVRVLEQFGDPTRGLRPQAA